WRTRLEPALLRDGGARRAPYVAGALFLPEARQIARITLPDRLVALPSYVALKFAHDLALLPLVRGWRGLRGQVGRMRDRLAGHAATLALLPMSAEERLLWKRRHAMLAAARRTVSADPSDLTAWTGLGDA